GQELRRCALTLEYADRHEFERHAQVGCEQPHFEAILRGAVIVQPHQRLLFTKQSIEVAAAAASAACPTLSTLTAVCRGCSGPGFPALKRITGWVEAPTMYRAGIDLHRSDNHWCIAPDGHWSVQQPVSIAALTSDLRTSARTT